MQFILRNNAVFAKHTYYHETLQYTLQPIRYITAIGFYVNRWHRICSANIWIDEVRLGKKIEFFVKSICFAFGACALGLLLLLLFFSIFGRLLFLFAFGWYINDFFPIVFLLSVKQKKIKIRNNVLNFVKNYYYK